MGTRLGEVLVERRRHFHLGAFPKPSPVSMDSLFEGFSASHDEARVKYLSTFPLFIGKQFVKLKNKLGATFWVCLFAEICGKVPPFTSWRFFLSHRNIQLTIDPRTNGKGLLVVFLVSGPQRTPKNKAR